MHCAADETAAALTVIDDGVNAARDTTALVPGGDCVAQFDTVFATGVTMLLPKATTPVLKVICAKSRR